MTTTNDGGPVHPMVMKAARAQFACDYEPTAYNDPELWEEIKGLYVCHAQRVLTECGALECLEVARMAVPYVRLEAVPTGEDLLNAAEHAIAKVYGSAPE